MSNIGRARKQRTFPYSIRKLKGVVHNKVVKEFPGQPNGLVQVGPEKWLMPEAYEFFAEKIYNFEARPDDVYICTFPRSGISWTQEMVWLLCNNLDYETALKKSQHERFPYLELHLLANETVLTDDSIKDNFKEEYDTLKEQKTRRFIKTHIPVQLMPQSIFDVGAKVIYVARNPKDVAVSYYHFHKTLPVFQYTGDFETFSQLFVNDLVIYGPYWKHALDGWSHRNDNNFHYMFYEDSISDIKNTLTKLAAFLQVSLHDEDFPKLMEHLKFENVKKNPSINVNMIPSPLPNQNLVRRGKVGGNPEMTKELSKKFDAWTKLSVANYGYEFPSV